MTLSDVSIRRPVFTAMMALALVVVGLLSFSRLPTDLYPPVDFPVMLVTVVYPGASPQDIERDVTRPIEDAVAGIGGLSKLQSFTHSGYTTVVMQFDMGTDLEQATSSVRDRVGVARRNLPNQAEEPIIQQIEMGALPVMVVALSSPNGVNATREMADERLRPFLEQVDGVGAVEILGGQDREIQVNLDLDRIRALGLSLTSVAQRIGIENLSMPVGQYDAHGYTIGVRAEAQYQSVEDLGSTIVHQTQDGQMVRLRDVATIVDGWTRPESYVRYNAQEAVTLSIVKRSGSNTVAVSDGVQEKLAEIVPTLGDGVQYDIIVDQSLDIRANAHEVWIAIYYGGFMAILVILFFLLDLRGTMISALALPVSVIGTFAAMNLFGFSINMMTLLALSLAIGLLIDDAVVVREAITRRLEAGDPPAVAASRGTSEIALAVLATTLSLVAVFVPVAFMSGMVGQFFKQFGLTMAMAVLISLFIAFTVDPMLSARFTTRHHHGARTGLAGRIERFLDRLDRGYRTLLNGALNHPYLVAGTTILALVVTAFVAASLPTEFVSKEDRGEVQADINLPIGTSLDQTLAAAVATEAKLQKLPDVLRVYSVIGQENRANRARFRVKFKPRSERPGRDIAYYEDLVRATLSEVPTAEVVLMQPAIIEGLGDFPPLMLIIQGEDLDTLTREANRVADILKAIPGSSDVRVTVNPGRPELSVAIDRLAAADRGVPAGLVAATARMLVEGEIAGSLRDGGAEAEIRLRADPSYADDAAAIAALPLPSQRGLITLGEVASVSMKAGPSEIQRLNRMRSITVTSQVANGAALGDLTTAFDKAIQEKPLPEGYFFVVDGQAKDMEETAAAMGLAVLIAGLFIFMVLASQFESLIHPFTLMMAVPLAMVGAFLGLAVAGKSISMGAQIGIILLMGLVTKNSILLVDGALTYMREEGLSPRDAMRAAGPRRLRPILMTSAAMVLGMVPTAIGTGIGAEFRAPMAIAVIGGVVSSTILTLLVVPVGFIFMEWVGGKLTGVVRWLSPDAVAKLEEKPAK